MDDRVASGEPVFGDSEEALRFVEVLREVELRDGWTVFAWCLMGNHDDLVLRTGEIALWRTNARLQGSFSRSHCRASLVGGVD